MRVFNSTYPNNGVTTRAFPRPSPDAQLYWDFNAPTTVGTDSPGPVDRFRAYLVRVVAALANGDLQFYFASHVDGSDISRDAGGALIGPHTIQPKDLALVWRHLPSTFESWNTANPYAFMMIDTLEMDRRAAGEGARGGPCTTFKLAADTSGGGTGKWPKAG